MQASSIVIVIVMSFIGALASFCFKKSTRYQTHGILSQFFHPLIFLGIALYLIAAFLNIYVLQILPYSIVLPLTSITYIWTMWFSSRYLHETITKKKIIGISFIIIGVLFLASSI